MLNNDLAMTIKAINKDIGVRLTIALISLATIIFLLTICSLQTNSKVSTETANIQISRELSSPVNITDVNETNSLNATNYSHNSFYAPSKKDIISLEILNQSIYEPQGLSQLNLLFLDSTDQDQIAGSEITLPQSFTGISETNRLDIVDSFGNSSVSSGSVPILLDTLKFITYNYGGYSVQRTDSNQFVFSFPNNTNQGRIAGSDALTLNTFAIQKIDFDAAFITPKINAFGFDEMVIFAASNIITYKGTEFGIRMDLKDGLIYGYVQEPNDTYGEVSFQMLKLIPNDGIVHHYTLIMLNSEVSFYIDGVDYGYLNFPTYADYSNLQFSILAVVHRFTDDWDSSGNTMIVKNFSLNQ